MADTHTANHVTLTPHADDTAPAEGELAKPTGRGFA